MSKSNLDQIKLLLQQCTFEELNDVLINVKYLSNTKGVQFTKSEDVLLHIAISEVLFQRLKVEPVELYILESQNSATYKKLMKVAKDLDYWVDDIFKNTDLTRIKRRMLFSLLTGIVADSIETSEYPLSLTSLLNFFNNLPGIVDKKFPGYLESGLLPQILLAHSK